MREEARSQEPGARMRKSTDYAMCGALLWALICYVPQGPIWAATVFICAFAFLWFDDRWIL